MQQHHCNKKYWLAELTELIIIHQATLEFCINLSEESSEYFGIRLVISFDIFIFISFLDYEQRREDWVITTKIKINGSCP